MLPLRGSMCTGVDLIYYHFAQGGAYVFETDASGGLVLVGCQVEDVRAFAPYIAAYHRPLHVHHHLGHTQAYQSHVVRASYVMTLPSKKPYNAI